MRRPVLLNCTPIEISGRNAGSISGVLLHWRYDWTPDRATLWAMWTWGCAESLDLLLCEATDWRRVWTP